MSNVNVKSEVPAWVVNPFRAVLALFLFGWFVKAVFFAPYLFNSVFEVPLVNDFFPGFFRANGVSACAYGAVLAGLVCFGTRRAVIFRSVAALLVACAFILCLHQNTYNDATFVVSFWAALWLFWLSACIGQTSPSSLRTHAAVLASCIVGMMFLGGFVGKLTPQYASGEIIARIFLEQGGESPLIFLLNVFDAQQKRAAVSLIAKLIIFGEGLLALNLIIHRRSFWRISLAVLPLLILFSSWRILSVISGLIGLLIAALMLKHHVRED